jgi:DNA primase
MPLSEFFFAEMSKDVNLGTLDGKARLAERCKPLLAQIPDGAFGDLMRQRLTELTGVGARASTPQTHVPTQRTHAARGTPAPKRSLVRGAIALLLQQPALALVLEPPYTFAALRQPGVELLSELITLVRERPDISTGAILEHFGEREEAAALQKLASQSLPGEEAAWRDEFLDAVAQLEKQTLQQRIDELQERIRESGLASLSRDEKAEILRLQGRTPNAPM